ncbi:ribonuclease D [Thalassotalea aquiviva]|uniref:ribonuclease D n=1 Tax=Thalassotalea aquiviva TaxID=3242415 RepID=UPI00352A7F31
MQHIYIQDSKTLLEYCQQAAKAEVLAIDTEFVRTRTLIPKLGLIQAYDGHTLALIDPVLTDDLSSFWQLLADPTLLKIIHSCSEDLEVFLHSGQCRPANMLDSQIAMAFLGHGLSMGYAAMVKHFLDIDLDKSESRTDWMKRPLSAKQLEYAAADVYYLHQISTTVIELVKTAGWYDAVMSDTDAMVDKKFSKTDPMALYLDFKGAWRLKPRQLLRLQYLLQWRYELAQKKDLPYSFIAKDHTLLIVAENNPKSVGAMASYEGVEILDVRHKGKAMLSVLNQVNQVPESEEPSAIKRLDNHPGYKQIFKRLKSFVQQLAKEQDLDIQVVAGKKQLNQFLAWYWKINQAGNQDQVELLSGWRQVLFADKLMAFAHNDFQLKS